jgi:D-glycero-alpha-D-manno-heptose-7-phosphate kinase
LGGGGTDLPSYYKQYGGYVLTAAINKYIFISVNDPFIKKFILKYAQNETVDNINQIKHPLIREVLNFLIKDIEKLEITSAADIPAGTGLGSSSSFTVGLIMALSKLINKDFDTKTLAEIACKIEINKLLQPIGKQDQYIAAFGGIKILEFKENDTCDVRDLNIKKHTILSLENRFEIYFTGITRSAEKVLEEQDVQTLKQDSKMIENLNFVKGIGLETVNSLENDNVDYLGTLMKEHWYYKKKRSKFMTNEYVDEMYNFALENGALGGKIIGAGGGGFLLFLSDGTNNLEKKMKSAGHNRLKFKFDFFGSQILKTE